MNLYTEDEIRQAWNYGQIAGHPMSQSEFRLSDYEALPLPPLPKGLEYGGEFQPEGWGFTFTSDGTFDLVAGKDLATVKEDDGNYLHIIADNYPRILFWGHIATNLQAAIILSAILGETDYEAMVNRLP